MKFPLLFLLFVVATGPAFAQSQNKEETSKIYAAGYRNIIATDSSRSYKPNTPATDRLHYRPEEIDLWYPAIRPKSNAPIPYGEFLNLLEQRSDRFQDDTVYNSLTAELVQYICVNLEIKDTSQLTRLKTASYRDAEEIRQPSPLILYLCAYNGMSYENINLFEWLATHGYVVACITSVGRYPGNMSTNPADLMEQVDDASFAIRYLKRHLPIDPEKIGAIGYSWGGLVALILAMNNTGIKAVLSLDGSEMHYYGESKQEDDDFDRLRNSSAFQPKKLQVPYAYLESGFKQTGREVDSIFNILPSLAFQKQYIRFPRATHEDFSCLPSLASRISGAEGDRPDLYKQFRLFSLKYFDRYLKDQENALSPELSSIYQQHAGDTLYPEISSVKKNGLILKGRVIDMKNKEALAYVNVGVPGKNTGTVSRRDGSFQINIDSALLEDSLKISMVGYQERTYSIAGLLNQAKPVVIRLHEKISELKEVVVTGKALPARTKGNRTTSRFVSIGLPLKFLGSETGIRIRLGKNPVLLKSFTFNISENRLDTAVFRMNIYNFKNGMPFENILRQNVLVPVGKQTGRYTVDLAGYKLLLKGDILISLEWIGGSSSGTQTGAIFLSAGFLNSATWHRLTSQAEWKKASGLGVGFNVVVQELKK